jgi:hypothetical protein
MRGALVGATAVFLGAGALLTGAGTASAASTTAAATTTAGTVTLTPRSTGLTDVSPFTQVSVSKACPAHYQDNLSVYLVVPDGTESSLAFDVTDGAPFSAAPVTARVPAASTDTTYVNSIADAFANVNATPADGTYPVHVVCGSADPADFPDRPTSTGFIDVSGDTWQPSGRPAPVATKIKLAATPAGHVQAGQTFTLTATVTPAVAGTVQFSADGGANPIGTPVPVTGGVASVQVPTNTNPAIRSYSALFVPADQLTYAQAYSVFDYAFVAAPTITVKDASGTVLGGTPQLTPGQRLTVSATGFLPTTGETVDVAVTSVYGPLPAVFPATSSDAAGSVNAYALTVPGCVSDGTHKLTLIGEKSHIKITLTFTTKRS